MDAEPLPLGYGAPKDGFTASFQTSRKSVETVQEIAVF